MKFTILITLTALLLCSTAVFADMQVLQGEGKGKLQTAAGSNLGLAFSTFLGGSGWDSVSAMTVGPDGCIYVTGTTESPDLPVTPGAYQSQYAGQGDAFVAKLDPTGTNLIYLTYLGGCDTSDTTEGPVGYDEGKSIAVDSSGCAYIVGLAGSSKFPRTIPSTSRGTFICKLDASGSSLLYSSVGSPYIPTAPGAIIVDRFDNVYVVGASSSRLIITEIDVNDLRDPPLSFYISLDVGGTVDTRAVAVDDDGCIYVTGYTSATAFPATSGAYDRSFNGGLMDAFVAKADPTTRIWNYITLIGGSRDEVGESIKVDSSGCAYITGTTDSTDFPTTTGALASAYKGGLSDAFVAKVNPDGSSLVYSTFLGGSGDDEAACIALDAYGKACVTGHTGSIDFPVTSNAFSWTFNGGYKDAYVAKLDSAGKSLAYSTFLGGSGEDAGLALAPGSSGSLFITGETWSADFSISQAACGGGDAFVAKLSLTPVLQVAKWPENGGSVTPSGIFGCDENALVQISAVPSQGYIFDRWDGDVSDPTSPNTSVRVDAPKAVTALFSTPDSGIGKLHGLPDGSPVVIPGKPVVGSMGDGFYIEEPDRSSGIRVIWSDSPAVGTTARILGRMATDGVERVIAADSVDSGLAGSVFPVFMANGSLGGHVEGVPWLGFEDSFGAGSLYNLGLLVKTSGRVLYTDPQRQFAYVDDGSGVYDGNTCGTGGTPVPGVRVVPPAGVDAPPAGQHVVLTGVSSTDTINGEPIRALRLRCASDISLPWGGMITGRICDGTVVTSMHTIESSHPYSGNCNDSWTIKGPAGTEMMRVHFQQLELESGCDYLHVRNGSGVTRQSFSNDMRIEDIWSGWVDGDTIKLNLTSDPGLNSFGFLIDKIEVQTAGLPVGMVTVSLSPGSMTTVTDENGRYCFSNLPAGTYTVTPSLYGSLFLQSSRKVSVGDWQYQAGMNFLRD